MKQQQIEMSNRSFQITKINFQAKKDFTAFRFIIVSSLVSCILMLGSCTRTLDIAPISSITSANYWKTEGDVIGYMTGIYAKFRVTMNTTYYLEDRGDSFDPGLHQGMSTAWAQNLTENSAPNWVNFYNLIHHCNLLIKYATPMKFSDPTTKNRVLAEAYFIRAYTYFYLVRVWGDVPLVLEPTESDDQPLLPRTGAVDIMKQIQFDIDKALSLFPEAGYVNKSRASAPACYALKADALLWKAKVLKGSQEDLTEAIAALDKVIPTVSLLPDFNKIYATDNRNNAEVVLSIYFQKDEYSPSYGYYLKPNGSLVNDAINKADIPYAESAARSQYAPSAHLEAAFDENADDVRKAGSIIKGVRSDGSLVGVFDNKLKGTMYPDGRIFDCDIIIYRLGGLLLLKAEALAALNKTSEAITALNKVRNRAGTGDYLGATDKLAVEKEILAERFRELYAELKRWPDLVRFHKEGVINLYNMVPQLAGKSVPLFFPISLAMHSLNPNLQQTEGYPAF
ncbi:MAG TPA: RagB/SusD family nutrient uptake outer membrane protein [Arachidicoccus sp.]|nr:RagB/SusD family nutrient uptake outer membrane protein [Arachidicoccus sp.]